MRVLLTGFLILTLACGDDASPDGGFLGDAGARDASSDVSGDSATRDVGSDSATDAGPDPSDAGPDAGPRELSAEVLAWQAKFDEEWDRALPYYTTETEGAEPDGTQRRYYDFRVIDGLIGMLKATGETRYGDDLIWYVDRIISLASESDDGYYDWPVGGTNLQLYDGHGLRNIFKFLWLLKSHPELRAESNFQEKYDEYLPWFTHNLWDKWVERGCNAVFRSRTHMASHMASNMALYLHLLEDDADAKAEYLSYVEAWNDDLSAKCPGAADEGIGFRDQLRVDARHGGYVWSSSWGQTTGSNDIGHANAEVQAVINQHKHGIGWSDEEMEFFVATMNALLDASPDADFAHLPEFLPAIYDASENTRPFITYGFAMLGRFDADLQTRMEGFSTSQFRASYYYSHWIANMAVNQAVLDGYVVYDE